MYNNVLNHYQIFARTFSLNFNFPIPHASFILFAAYLFQKNLASTTIISYISALGFWQKLNGGIDYTESFLLKRVLAGIKRQKPSIDCRLPITQNILFKLLHALNFCSKTPEQIIMFKSMYLLAFHGFLRLSELTVNNNNDHCLSFNDIVLASDETSVVIKFRSFKHSNGKSESIVIYKQSGDNCPISALTKFLKLRGNAPGPLYVYPGSFTPVNRNIFVRHLNACLSFCNLSPSLYKSHSFRIGAATTAASEGFSDAQIRKLGRWHSNAFLSYIRL